MEAYWMWGGQDVRRSVREARGKIFKPCPLISSNASVKMKKQRWTTGKKQLASRGTAKKLACFWLRTDRRLRKIDKFIVFCLAQGKSGCVSLEKVGGGGHGPPGSAPYDYYTCKHMTLHPPKPWNGTCACTYMHELCFGWTPSTDIKTHGCISFKPCALHQLRLKISWLQHIHCTLCYCGTYYLDNDS